SEIAERRRIERLVGERADQLQARDERTRLFLENALDAFISIDSQGAIVDWNRQAETLLGWKRDEVLGRKLADVIIPPAHREAHAKGLARYLATGEGPILN